MLLAARAGVAARMETAPSPRCFKVGGADAVIELLPTARADSEVAMDEGSTPLHWTAGRHVTAGRIKALLASRTKPAVRAVYCNMPVCVFARRYPIGNENLHAGAAIETSLDPGGNPMARSVAGARHRGISR